MLSRQQETLLQFVRRTLWQEDLPLPSDDWNTIEILAEQQGVLWMLYPGSKKAAHIPREKQVQWRNSFLANALHNESLNTFQCKLLAYLKNHEIRTAVLKGTSCSRYYAVPSARPLGDIDILIDLYNVDAVADHLHAMGFTRSSIHHGFHIGFSLDQITVEVHYHCSELPKSKGTDAALYAESTFLDQVLMAEMDGLCFPVLSENHQALMLLMHMERHMQEDGLGLRQLCDWAMFVHGSDPSHWDATVPLLKSCGLYHYASVLTQVCIKYLGLPSAYATWAEDIDTSLVEALMHDIFDRGSFGQADDQHTGILFSDRSIMGKRKQGTLQGMLAKMTNLAQRKYPIAKRYPVFLPAFYCYIPLNYAVHSLFCKKAKRSLRKAISASQKRQQLYQTFHLYEVAE